MSAAIAIHECAQCGKGFAASRRNTKYCSDACKQAAHRRRQDPVPDLAPEDMALLVEHSLMRGDLETKADRVGACVEFVATLARLGLVPALARALREIAET